MLALLPPVAAPSRAAATSPQQPGTRPLWWLQVPVLLVAGGLASAGLLIAGPHPLRFLAIAVLALGATIALELLAMRWLRRDLPSGPAILPADGSAAHRLAQHRAAWQVVGALLAPFPSLALRALALRLAGAQVGRGVIIESLACFPDPHLVLIGDGAIVEAQARVMGCDTCNGRLRFAPVMIGERALVCRSSVLRPAAVVACGAIVCASSEVGCSQQVGPGAYHLAAAKPAGGEPTLFPRRQLPLTGG